MTSPLPNPTPIFRYSYAEGTIPDFSVDFSVEPGGDNSLIIHVGQQEHTITIEEIEEWQSDPRAGSLISSYLYADATRTLVVVEGIALLTIGPDHKMTLSDERGMSGNITCSNEEITITLNIPGQSSTLSFDAPEWCYYPDENGEYGLYNFIDMDEGTLYASTAPICPELTSIELPNFEGYIFYNDGYLLTTDPTATLPEPPVLTQTIENNVVSDIHWTVDDTDYPVGMMILPLEVTPSPAASPILEIPIIYDSSTRRITLPQGHDLYGGATTDVDSVKISVTGIVPEGTNFIVRVDFAVLVETGNRVVNRPFILLEQIEDRWEAIIPNAILRATKDVHRLPIQLILANDSQVINSRNTIVLETTTAIDATTSGNEIPDYEMPDWPLPTGVSESLDVLTLDVTYDPLTRMITLPDSDMYGGATIDTNSVRINVTGIPSECDARLDFATAIRIDNSTVIKPFVVLDSIGTVFSAMIPQSVLMAAKETKKLPFQLVTRHGDTVINSRNTIVLEITRAINAMESVESVYAPYIMYRNDTWEWVEDFTYDTGAVVVYNGEMYTSLSDDNLGYEPDENPEKWSLLSGIESVTLGGIEGTKDGSNITFTSEQVFAATGLTSAPVPVNELDVPTATWSVEND